MARIVGGTEFNKLRTELGVGPADFDKYFIRQGSRILVRDKYDPKFPTKNIRNIALEAGRPAAYADVSSDLVKNAPDLEQTRLFGSAVTDLLKSYQQIAKYPYREAEIAGREEQAKRLSFTDPSLIGAAPGVQAAARGASVSAVEPTVSGAREAGQTFTGQLETFRDVLAAAQGLQAQEEGRALQARAEAQGLISTALEQFGGEAFGEMDQKELERLEKLAGYPRGYVQQVSRAIKVREEKALKAQAPSTMETSQGIFQWNATTGKWEATGLRGKPTSGAQGAWSVETDPITGRQYRIHSLTGEIRPIGEQEGGQGTFEQFVAQKEQEAGQSFSQTRRDQLRAEFEQSTKQKLPKHLISPVQQVAGQFDNEQIVKSYNTTQEGYQTIASIGTKTKSPSDDIAFIYAFAKIMDPNSVVREGEYNTIQRYAQNWAQTFGFNAKRIFSNTSFLASDTKQKMLNTLAPKVRTIQRQYENVFNEYARRIDNITGQTDGALYLTQYALTPQNQQDTRPPLSSFLE